MSVGRLNGAATYCTGCFPRQKIPCASPRYFTRHRAKFLRRCANLAGRRRGRTDRFHLRAWRAIRCLDQAPREYKTGVRHWRVCPWRAASMRCSWAFTRTRRAQVKTVSCREFAMSSRRALPFGGVTPVPARGTASPDAARLELPTPHDCPCRLAHRSETGDVVTVRVERRRTAKSYAFLLRCGQSGGDAFTDDLEVELSHSAKNVHLKLASRVRPRRVDTLLRHDHFAHRSRALAGAAALSRISTNVAKLLNASALNNSSTLVHRAVLDGVKRGKEVRVRGTSTE